MATNKGIPVINNFDLYAQKPLDSRVVIENEQELGELVNKGAIYDGMIFYRKDAQKFFQAQYLESGLTFTEFGGATSLDDCLFLVANASQQVVLTQEQYNNIVNKKYNFIFLSFDGILLLPTYINATTEKVDIYFSVTSNDITKMIITTLMFFWTPTQLASGMSPYPASLDIGTEELSYIYFDNGEPKEIKFVGLPSIDNLDVSKPFVPQAKGGVVNWVEQSADATSLTLNLMTRFSFDNPIVRTTLTKEEKEKWEAGYYSNVQYVDDSDEYSSFIGAFLPQVVKNVRNDYEGKITQQSYFALYGGKADASSPLGVGISKCTMYAINFAETANSDGTYNFTVEKDVEFPFASSGSSSTPTLATAFSTTDYATITLTDEDVATIKKQENNFIIIKTTGNISTENNLCSVTKTEDNEYELTTISGGLVSLLNFADITGGYRFVIDTSTKKITNSSLFGSLSITSTSLYLNNNELFLTSSINSPTSNKVNKSYYVDTINGQPILHETQTEAKNHIISTYYNHFIYLALETTTNGTATIRINFTNTSSELINTLDKLKTALGQTFTLGGNGAIVNGSTYGTTYMLNQNSITGVVNGAQQVFNFADGTLTITDSVKQA